MEKTSLVKLSNKKAGRSNDFSLRGNVLTGGMCFNSGKISNEIHRVGDFQGKKVSLVEGKENSMMDGADGGDRRNSAGSDLLC